MSTTRSPATGPGVRVRGTTPPPGPRRPPGARAPHAERERQALRRMVTLLGLTLLAPGAAQFAAGRRELGRVLLRITATVAGVVLLLVLVWLVHRETVLGLFTHQWVLRPLALLCFAAGVAWPALLLDAWRLGRPAQVPIRARRAVAVATVVLLLITCLAPIALGKRVWAGAEFLGGVFGSGRRSAATDGRYNVLLLGGDAGPDRVGTRPDSVNLASIDEKTGRTVLFSLPRNMQNVPFPAGTPAARAMPHGFDCGDVCLLNAVYKYGAEHPRLFPGGTADKGAEAMKEVVSAATGLPVNYYVLIDLQGFRSLIDAVGGIDVDVLTRVPIGGGTSPISGWIEPGRRHLNGFHALWYGRSREGASDYARMARQRCVMDAMLDQLDPSTVLKNFQSIASASKQVVSTDIPAGQLPDFLTLGEKAKAQKIQSVQFVPPLIVPHHPDFGVVRHTVATTIADAAKPATARPSAAAPAPAASGGTSGTSRTSGTRSKGAAAPQPSATVPAGPVDVSQVCTPA